MSAALALAGWLGTLESGWEDAELQVRRFDTAGVSSVPRQHRFWTVREMAAAERRTSCRYFQLQHCCFVCAAQAEPKLQLVQGRRGLDK